MKKGHTINVRSPRLRSDNSLADMIKKCAGIVMICSLFFSVRAGKESANAWLFWAIFLPGAMNSLTLYCFSEIIVLLEEIRNIGLVDFVRNEKGGE